MMVDYLEKVLDHITQNVINKENEKKTRKDVGENIVQLKNVQNKKETNDLKDACEA